ncbi:MAG: hypothetical protein ACT4OP_03215 [Actinomycetota bacterium]
MSPLVNVDAGLAAARLLADDLVDAVLCGGTVRLRVHEGGVAVYMPSTTRRARVA